MHLFMNAWPRLAEMPTPTLKTGLPLSRAEGAEAVRHAHAGIVDAIARRDSATALARMERRLNALMPLMH